MMQPWILFTLFVTGLAVTTCEGKSENTVTGNMSDGGNPTSGGSTSTGGTSSVGGSTIATGGTDSGNCLETETSTLLGVSIHFSQPLRCKFTLAEAAAGVSIGYVLAIDQDIPDVSPQAQSTCVQPGPSGLYVFELLSGNGERYCLCDNGFCSPPPADPTTLLMGSYPGAFSWEGRYWTGHSDTNNPQGPAFPAGSYTLMISALGSYAGASFEVSDSMVITLAP